MKVLSATRSGPEQPRIILFRLAFSLLLLAVLFTLVRGVRLKPSSDDPTHDPPELDSFSKPAVAAALLKVEVDSVFADYGEYLTQVLKEAQPPHTSAPFGSVPRPQNIPLARLQELHQQIEYMDTTLDYKLMAACERNGLGKEFLDLYLERLGAHTDDSFLAPLAPAALRCAKQCQRTGELLDALQDFTVFHPELKTSAKLARVLQDWQATTGPSPAVRSQ